MRYHSFPGLRSNWDNQTLFDFDGKALPALRVFNIPMAGTAAPPAPGRVGAVPALNSVLITWLKTIGADQYQIERAQSANGPWTMLDNNIPEAVNPSYNDTGLIPGAAYYYRLRAHNSHGWGDYCRTCQVQTVPMDAPGNFRVSYTTGDSVILRWDSFTGASGYEIYFAQAETEPADGAYTSLSNPSDAAVEYVHTGLTDGDIYWYKIRSIHNVYGNSSWSNAVNAEVRDSKSVISMSTAALDADFTDPGKAASSTDSLYPVETPTNYRIEGLYAANDAVNLYVALDFGSNQPAGWQNDRIVVWIDNIDSSVGGANLTAMKIVENQTVINHSIEAVVYKRLNASVGGTPGAAINTPVWVQDTDWLYKPPTPAGETVVKFSIPLANIGNAVPGNELKITAAFTKGWDNPPPLVLVIGDIVPGAVTSARENSQTAVINMANALSFIVK